MTKFKGLIEKPASKTNLSIKIDMDIANLHDEVKQLLKITGSKLNLDRTLEPIIRNILQDAKHQLTELKTEQSGNTSKLASNQKEVEAELA